MPSLAKGRQLTIDASSLVDREDAIARIAYFYLTKFILHTS